MQMTAVAFSWAEAVAGSSGALAEWIELTDGWSGSAVVVQLSGSANRVRCQVEGQRVVAHLADCDVLSGAEVDALVSCGWLVDVVEDGWYRSWLRSETPSEVVVEDVLTTLGAIHLARASLLHVEVSTPGR